MNWLSVFNRLKDKLSSINDTSFFRFGWAYIAKYNNFVSPKFHLIPILYQILYLNLILQLQWIFAAKGSFKIAITLAEPTIDIEEISITFF